MRKLISKRIKKIKKFASDFSHTINGWRFEDLKQHIKSNKFPDLQNSLTFSSSISEAQASLSGVDRVAFVSPLPPEDTGIATCSFYSWLGGDDCIDLFCPVVDADIFFAMKRRLQSRGMRLFDVGALFAIDGIENYKYIVFAIGNSEHHLYFFECLKKLELFGSLDRVVMYIHDPCLLNIVQKGTRSSSKELVDLMATFYPDRIENVSIDASSNWKTHGALAELGVLGLRYFHSVGIDKFFVNSSAAEQLINHDLGGRSSSIMRLFHPVFLPLGGGALPAKLNKESGSDIVVGTFGIPNASKLTHIILEAVGLLQSRGFKVKLIIAGFSARRYSSEMRAELSKIDCQVFDGPTDAQLLATMSKVDVAVQLRAKNLGESSGVVPQLLALGKPVIVCPVGSFLEFGDAVKFVSLPVDADDLADLMLTAMNAGGSLAVDRYVNEHSPERFRDAFFAGLRSLSRKEQMQ